MKSRRVAWAAIEKRSRSEKRSGWKLCSLSWFSVLKNVAGCGESVLLSSVGIESHALGQEEADEFSVERDEKVKEDVSKKWRIVEQIVQIRIVSSSKRVESLS